MKFYFYLGLLIIVGAEILLFAGIKWVGIFFTPIVWTGFILLIDGIVFKIKQSSWLVTRSKSFLIMIPLSAAFWWMFEFFNLFIKNWRYEGLPTPWISAIGMTWAFATIGPAMFETRDLLLAIGAFKLRAPKFKIKRVVLNILIILGAFCFISILIAPPKIAKHLATPLWVGFILLLDPINCIQGRSSILNEWQAGEWQNFLCLFVTGFICGLLWEFWNYWAYAKWVYTVPIRSIKIFEMPLLGYLGFPALALEYYALYSITLNWKYK